MESIEIKDKTKNDEVDTKSKAIKYSNHRVSVIYLSRFLSNKIEYLVQYNDSPDGLSKWISSYKLMNSIDCSESLNLFNNNNFKFQFYVMKENDFDIPMNVVARKTEKNGKVKYLTHYVLESGNVFCWDLEENIPKNLLKSFNDCSIDSHESYEKPGFLEIRKTKLNSFKSKDNHNINCYQLESINWILNSFCKNNIAILNYEYCNMNSLELLLFLKILNDKTDYHGPHLIIVDSNDINKWENDIRNWTDFKFITYCGNEKERNIYRKYIFHPLGEKMRNEIKKFNFNLLLTSKDIFLKDYELLNYINWNIVSLSERDIVEYNKKKSQTFSKLNYAYKIIITESLSQNKLYEIQKLIDNINNLHDGQISNNKVSDLKKDVSKYILSIKDKSKEFHEKVVFLKLTEQQENFLKLLQSNKLDTIIPKKYIHNNFSFYRKACNHLFLIHDVDKYFYRKKNTTKLNIFNSCSTKFFFLNQFLPILKKEKFKVLMFSHSRKTIDIIEDFCKMSSYSYIALKENLTEKENLISKFSDQTKNIFIFIISSNCSLNGLNISEKTISIVFEPIFNEKSKSNDISSYYAYGQNNNNYIIRLVTYETYECELFLKIKQKNSIINDILGLSSVIGQDKIEIPNPPPSDNKIRPKSNLDEILKKYSFLNIGDIDLLKIPQINIPIKLEMKDFVGQFLKMNENETNLNQKNAEIILSTLGKHGYGEWNDIINEINIDISLKQLILFCDTAIILFFRAINWEDIVDFPFLLKKLQSDFEMFDFNNLMCFDQSEWYSKRGFTYASPCKDLYTYIYENANKFLTNLEKKLILNEWGNQNINLSKDLLFWRYYNPEHIISNSEIFEKDHYAFSLIRKKCFNGYFNINFWTNKEVNILLSSIHNYGDLLVSEKKQLNLMTGVFTKPPGMIMKFIKFLFSKFNKRSHHKVYLIPDEISNISSAPKEIQKNLEIKSQDFKHAKNGYKLIQLLKYQVSTLKISTATYNKYKVKYAKDFYKNLLKFGLNYFYDILLSPQFRTNFTYNDLKYLETKDKNYIKQNSKIPNCFLDEDNLIEFLEQGGDVNQISIVDIHSHNTKNAKTVFSNEEIIAFEKLKKKQQQQDRNSNIRKMNTIEYINFLQKLLGENQFLNLRTKICNHLHKENILPDMQHEEEEDNFIDFDESSNNESSSDDF